MAKLPLTGERRRAYTCFDPCCATDLMYSLVGMGSRNKVRRSAMEPRMELCQCFETERQWARSLIRRCERIISRSSV